MRSYGFADFSHRIRTVGFSAKSTPAHHLDSTVHKTKQEALEAEKLER